MGEVSADFKFPYVFSIFILRIRPYVLFAKKLIYSQFIEDIGL